MNSNSNSYSKELEIEPEPEVPKGNHNMTELLRIRSNNIPRNLSDGKDMRYSGLDLDMDLEKEKEENVLQTLRKNAAKMQLLSFLENPGVTDIQKIERIRDPVNAELLSWKNSSSLDQEKIQAFRMEAGGFWKDWDDAIFLFL